VIALLSRQQFTGLGRYFFAHRSNKGRRVTEGRALLDQATAVSLSPVGIKSGNQEAIN